LTSIDNVIVSSAFLSETSINIGRRGGKPMTHLGTNPKLMSSLSYFDQAFKIKEGKLRIFVPLCGKTQDLRW
jgi:hypothetical protein